MAGATTGTDALPAARLTISVSLLLVAMISGNLGWDYHVICDDASRAAEVVRWLVDPVR